MTDSRRTVTVAINQKGAQKTSREIRGVGTASLQAKAGVNSLISSLAGLGIGLGLASAIREMAEFGQEMSTVRAVSRATAGEFKQLRQQARELGATTRFSATEAAQGQKFLAQAGFTAQQNLAALPATLQLAQAGALDLGSAADIASNVLTGFGIAAERAGEVSDVLAFAATNSNTNVRQLGEGLKFVAPVASGLGVSLQETTAAMGALSDAGLQSSLAGTGLRRVLSELESPAKKSRDILARYGLTAEDVQVSSVGLTTALQALTEAGVSTGDSLALFGDRGGPAFSVLSRSLPKVQSMTDALDDAGGTAARISKIMDDNLNGAFKQLTSAVSELILSISDLGAGSGLRDFIESLTKGVRLAAANVDKLTDSLILMGGAIALAIGPTKALGAALRFLTLGLAANPFAALVVAIVAAVGALTLFRDEIVLFEKEGLTVGDTMAGAFNLIRDEIISMTQPFESLNGLVVEFFDSFTFDKALEALVFFGDRVLALLSAPFAGLAAAFKVLPEAVKAAMTRIANFIVTGAEKAINRVVDLANVILPESLQFTRVAFSRFESDTTTTFTSAAEEIGKAMQRAFSNRPISDAIRAIEKLTDKVKESAEIVRQARVTSNVGDFLFGGDLAGAASSRGASSTQRPDFNLSTDLAAGLAPRRGPTGDGGTGSGRGSGARSVTDLRRAVDLEEKRLSVLRLSDAFRSDAVQSLNDQLAIDEEILRIRKEYEEANKKVDEGLLSQFKTLQMQTAEIERQRQITQAAVSLQSRLDPVFAAQQSLAGFSEEITAAFVQGEITAERMLDLWNRANARLRDSLDPVAAFNRGLQQEIMLLGLSNKEREIEVAFIREKQRLEGTGVSDETIRAGVTQLSQAREISGIRRRAEAEIKGISAAQKELNETLTLDVFNKAFADGLITLEQLREKQVQLRLDSLETSRTFADGYTRAFIKMGQEAQNFAQISENAVNTFAEGSSKAISDLVLTGRADWKSLANSIISDIVRMTTRALVFKAISSTLGSNSAITTGAGNGVQGGDLFGLGAAFASGLNQFAGGGTFRVGGQAGTDQNIVAFRASRNEEVSVRTPGQQRQQEPVIAGGNTIIINAPPIQPGADEFETQVANRRHARNSLESANRDIARGR